jgi:DNA-binding CsgD family transcriptional regulator
MAEKRGPTPADVRSMLRLSRTLHTTLDAVDRKTHLLSGLCDMLDAASALNVVAHVETAPRRQTIVSVTRHGTSRAREDELLTRCLPALDLLPSGHSREDDSKWQHVVWPMRASRSLRLCHCIWYWAPIADARIVACISVMRQPSGNDAFGSRERMLLHLAHMEMSWVYDSDLLLATHGAASLSPRQRQTLEYLLFGHSEKQIAAKMRLSPNTVHHHIKALHRHFGVSSRSELLARWVR